MLVTTQRGYPEPNVRDDQRLTRPRAFLTTNVGYRLMSCDKWWTKIFLAVGDLSQTYE